MAKKDDCCDNWHEAQKSGTDNEGYSSAISELDDAFVIGAIPAAVKFCPWCGSPKQTDREQ